MKRPNVKRSIRSAWKQDHCGVPEELRFGKKRETCGGLSIYNFRRNWSDDCIHFNRPQEPHLHASEFWFPHITREQVKPKSCEFINI